MDPFDITMPISVNDNKSVFVPCNAPAPVVANGGLYIGCSLDPDHEGEHKTMIIWTR